MKASRWWDAAVVGVSVVLAAVMTVNVGSPALAVGGYVAITAFVLAWFGLGRRAVVDAAFAVPYAILLVLFAGLLTSFDPNLATFQAVIYPLLWTLARSMREAIITNISAALSVGFGLWVAFGTDITTVSEIALIVALSLGFSIAMGLWISRTFALSEEREVLLADLRAAQDSLSALSRDAGVTSERERLAREIHDTIAQDLTGLVLLSQQSRRSLAAGDLQASEDQLALLEENARLALSETRALVAATSPAALEDGGIAPALARLAERFTRESGIIVSIESDVRAALDRPTEVVLLRCTQEGLSNVRKHSGATAVTLTLDARDHGTTLSIADNGSGFDPAMVQQGFGLAGMRDRLALVSGTLTIDSSPAGTRLVAALPPAASTTAGASATAAAAAASEPESESESESAKRPGAST